MLFRCIQSIQVLRQISVMHISNETSLPTPSISMSFSITPRSHKEGEDVPTLSITTTLSSTSSITIFTWPTALNPRLALKRRNFTAYDLSDSPPSLIGLESTKGPKRRGFQQRKGHADEQWYLTLFPNTPVTISYPLNILKRTRHDTDGHNMPVFQPGHAYRLAVSEGETLSTWWWGTTDNVLADESGPEKNVRGIQGADPLYIHAEAVDFAIH